MLPMSYYELQPAKRPWIGVIVRQPHVAASLTTSLVHECYLRLVKVGEIERRRGEFFAPI